MLLGLSQLGSILGLVKPLVYLAIPSLLTVVLGVAWTIATNYGAAQAAIQRAVEIDEKNRVVFHIREESLIQDSEDFREALKNVQKHASETRLKEIHTIPRVLGKNGSEGPKERPQCPINCTLPSQLFLQE